MNSHIEAAKDAADDAQQKNNIADLDYKERLELARAQEARATSLTFGGGFGQLRRLG